MKINVPQSPANKSNSSDCISKADLMIASFFALDLFCRERGLDKVAHDLMLAVNAFDNERLVSLMVEDWEETYGESDQRWFMHFLNKELDSNLEYYLKKEEADFFVDLDLMEAILVAFSKKSRSLQVPVFA